MIICPLCGYRFSGGASQLCTACPLANGCRLVCCPNCKYQWPAESRTVEFFKRVFSRKEKTT